MVKKQTQTEKLNATGGEIKIFIIKTNAFCEEILCGLPLFEILAREMQGFEILFLQDEAELLSKLKNNAAFCEKVVVLYSDCPLITRITVESTLNFLNKATSFGRSFAAGKKFLKTLKSLDELKEFEGEAKEEYMQIKNEGDLLKAKEILQNRLAALLLKDNIEIENCQIDLTSEIECGARLAASQILGSCNIGACIIIGSVVENCIVASGVTVENCVLKNCIVTKNIFGKNHNGGIV